MNDLRTRKEIEERREQLLIEYLFLGLDKKGQAQAMRFMKFLLSERKVKP